MNASIPIVMGPFPIGIAAFLSGNEAEAIGMPVFLSGNAPIPIGTAAFHLGNERCTIVIGSFPTWKEAILPVMGLFTIVPAAFPTWNPAATPGVEAPKRDTMKVSCIKAGVKDLSSAALVAKADHVHTSLLGNPHFPAPVPDLATLAAATRALEAALAEAQGRATAAVALRWERHGHLEALLVQLSEYVKNTAPGSVERQLTSGFELRRPPARITELEKPVLQWKRTGLQAQAGLHLRWSAVHGARVFQVFQCTGTSPEHGPWQLVETCTRRSTTLATVPPGQQAWFMVQAVGATGPGPSSAPVQARMY